MPLVQLFLMTAYEVFARVFGFVDLALPAYPQILSVR